MTCHFITVDPICFTQVPSPALRQIQSFLRIVNWIQYKLRKVLVGKIDLVRPTEITTDACQFKGQRTQLKQSPIVRSSKHPRGHQIIILILLAHQVEANL